MLRFAIIGAGSWGTALSIIAGRAGHRVRLWSRNAGVVEEIRREHVNQTYLAPHVIPEEVEATNDLSEALQGAEVVLLASPSHATRALLAKMLPALRSEMIFVSATEGVEIETGKRISEVLRDV